MDRWVLRALRDWRVWALTLTIQGPGARALVRYAPWPAVLLPTAGAVAILFYGACLHGPLVPWIRRAGSRLGIVAAVLCVAAAVNLAVYPRVDALKLQGRGSDEDDALIETARRLVTLQRPLYVPTYLGNTPSVGPGWAALVSPLAVPGAYALLTPLAVAVLVWTVRWTGGGNAGIALALLLPLASPGFWDLSVTGSDLFAIGVLFVTLTRLAWGWRKPGPATSVVGAALLCAAATARAPFAYVTACVSLFMWRTRRAGAARAAGVTAAVVAAEAWAWLPDAGRTPLFLFSKVSGVLGIGGVVLAATAAVASAVWAIGRVDGEVESWWFALWAVLVVPLAIVSVGALAALGWQIASWQAAGYVEVAVPALVAYVGTEAERRQNVS